MRRKVNLASSLIKLLTLSISSASMGLPATVSILAFLPLFSNMSLDQFCDCSIHLKLDVHYLFSELASAPPKVAFSEVPNPREESKGDQAKYLAPITVCITVDVKPKPNVANIQVSRNEQVVLPFNTSGKFYIASSIGNTDFLSLTNFVAQERGKPNIFKKKSWHFYR